MRHPSTRPVGSSQKVNNFGHTPAKPAKNSYAASQSPKGSRTAVQSPKYSARGSRSSLTTLQSPKSTGRMARLTRLTKEITFRFLEKTPLNSLTEKERKHRAACIIQNKFRWHYNKPRGGKVNRAARIITSAMRKYKSFIVQEKWLMIATMERKARAKSTNQEERDKVQKEKESMQEKKNARMVSERAARKSGWAGTTTGIKWTKREEAIFAAINIKFGYPQDEKHWQNYYSRFLAYPKKAVRAKLTFMKDEGVLGDPNIMSHIEKEELEELGLAITKETKKKVPLQRKA